MGGIFLEGGGYVIIPRVVNLVKGFEVDFIDINRVSSLETVSRVCIL